MGTVVGAPVTATDLNADDVGKLTYDLSGADAGSFNIDKMTGQITVAAELDHERSGGETYAVAVGVSDPSVNDETTPFDTAVVVRQAVIITVTDVNEAPSVTGSAAVSNHFENDSVDDTYTALAETYTPSDLDAGDDVDDLTLSLSGADEAVFELGAITNAATGARVLNFKTAPNYEAPADADGNNIYKVTVVATDDDGITGEQAVTVSVTNVNEGGSLSLSSMQPQSGVALTATLSDPDGGETEIVWKWESSPTGAANSFVEIEGATSASYTPVSSVDDDPDTEANEAVDGDEGKFLQVTVTYNDDQKPDDPDTEGDEGVDRTLTAEPDNAVREAPDTNNAPVFTATITREVDEGTPTGGNVGDPVEATDADDDELTYTLSGGADMASFDIDPGTGQITVGAGTELNFEGDQTTYMVEVTAADAFGESGTVMVTIMVEDVDEPPTTPTLGTGQRQRLIRTTRLSSRMTRPPGAWTRTRPLVWPWARRSRRRTPTPTTR